MVSTSSPAHFGLFGAHVRRRPDHHPVLCVVATSQSAARSVALAIPKSMTFGTGTPSCSDTQDVRRLDVAVDDALLVSVLDGLDRPARTAPAAAGASSRCVSQYSVIGIPGTCSIAKYGRPSGVAPASNTLAMLGCDISANAWRSASKRGDHLFGVHAQLDDLQGDFATPYGCPLAQRDNTISHPALAENLEKLVRDQFAPKSTRPPPKSTLPPPWFPARCGHRPWDPQSASCSRVYPPRHSNA